MDFQPTAQPLVAGVGLGWVGLVAESPARSGAWPGGWDCAGGAASPPPGPGPAAGGWAFGRLRSSASQTKRPHPCKLDRRLLVCAVLRTRQDRDWASCPTRPRHASGPCGSRPCAAPPARPLTHSGGSARHGKKKEEQEQKRHTTCPAPLPSDRSHPRMAWIYCVDQGRHLPGIAIYQPSSGNRRRRGGVGWQDRWRHGWRHRAPRDWFTACPANPHRPAQPAETQSRFGFGPWLWLRRVQGAALQRKRPPFGGLTSLYFSLISRRRSSRKPWAVIASGYRLGFSGVMQDGSTSIRKSGFGCRKNGTE